MSNATAHAQDELPRYLRHQFEYYFSKQNLTQDKFLRSQMDANGWVSLDVLMSFNKIKQRTDDRKLVIEVIASIPNLVLDGAREYVRVAPTQRSTVMLRDMQFEEDIRSLLNDSGVTMPMFEHTNVGNNWYLHFESESDALRAQKFLQERHHSASIKNSLIPPPAQTPQSSGFQKSTASSSTNSSKSDSTAAAHSVNNQAIASLHEHHPPQSIPLSTNQSANQSMPSSSSQMTAHPPAFPSPYHQMLQQPTPHRFPPPQSHHMSYMFPTAQGGICFVPYFYNPYMLPYTGATQQHSIPPPSQAPNAGLTPTAPPPMPFTTVMTQPAPQHHPSYSKHYRGGNNNGGSNQQQGYSPQQQLPLSYSGHVNHGYQGQVSHQQMQNQQYGGGGRKHSQHYHHGHGSINDNGSSDYHHHHQTVDQAHSRPSAPRYSKNRQTQRLASVVNSGSGPTASHGSSNRFSATPSTANTVPMGAVKSHQTTNNSQHVDGSSQGDVKTPSSNAIPQTELAKPQIFNSSGMNFPPLNESVTSVDVAVVKSSSAPPPETVAVSVNPPSSTSPQINKQPPPMLTPTAASTESCQGANGSNDSKISYAAAARNRSTNAGGSDEFPPPIASNDLSSNVAA